MFYKAILHNLVADFPRIYLDASDVDHLRIICFDGLCWKYFLLILNQEVKMDNASNWCYDILELWGFVF